MGPQILEIVYKSVHDFITYSICMCENTNIYIYIYLNRTREGDHIASHRGVSV